MGGLVSSLMNLFWSQKMELVIIGLENSGKSTLASQLCDGEAGNNGPTIGLDIKNFKKGNVDFKCWDLGGQGNQPLLTY